MYNFELLGLVHTREKNTRFLRKSPIFLKKTACFSRKLAIFLKIACFFLSCGRGLTDEERKKLKEKERREKL